MSVSKAEKNIQDEVLILSKKFLLKLDSDLESFKKLFNQIKSNKLERSQIEDSRNRIHKIAGSAKIFGFEEIGNMAADIESILDQALLDEKNVKIDPKIDSFLESFINISEITIKKNGSETKEDDNKKEEDKKQKKSDKKAAKYKIVLAEDNEVVQDLVKKVFEEKDYDLEIADDGQSAIKIIKANKGKINLLLSDVNMPKKNGFELLQEIKKMGIKIPTLMLTRRDQDEDLIKAMSLGADDYLTKPFDLLGLKSKVDEILKNEQKTILVADDDDMILDILSSYFKKMGYNVLNAKNGIDAINLAKENSVDLLILDYMMPKLDGIAVLKKIRNDKKLKETPVIMLSAKSQQENIIYGLENGADDYLVKPFDLEEVSVRVLKILRK